MISKRDAMRIAGDAYIACDKLESIIICGRSGNLHPDYLKEKVDTAQRCLDFMKHFYEEKKK